MKVGFDAKRAFANRTGLGNYGRFVIESMTAYFKEYQYFLFAPKKNILLETNISTTHIVLPALPWFSFLWRSFFIKSDLVKNRIDVFHGLSNEIPFGLKSVGIKTVVTIHDLIFLRYPHYYKFFDRLIYNFKFRYAAENADHIIAISQQTKRDIIDFYQIEPNKISVVYQSCNAAFATPSNLKESIKEKYGIKKAHIICVGTIEDRKNQLNLVKAFHNLGIKDIDLVIVGRGKAYKQQVLDYIIEHNLENVKILEDVNNEELIALYQTSLFAVYISVFEGFGIPVIEALSAGVPVLAATGSCLEEAGGDAAIYVEPTSVNAIENSLKILIENDVLRLKLKLKAKEQLENFEPQKIAAQINDIYEAL